MQMERTAFHLKAEGECQADWKQEEFRAANKQQQKSILYYKIFKIVDLKLFVNIDVLLFCVEIQNFVCVRRPINQDQYLSVSIFWF